uniref:Uncharacterized protein n=1 Tax=Schistocephalus solidus TaxID=70667 RepID=A0A0X3NTN1_SCHSO
MIKGSVMRVGKKRLPNMETCFKGRLSRTASNVFSTADTPVHFSIRPILYREGKDKLPAQTTSIRFYSFSCPIGAEYIGSTSWRLFKRRREHLSAWLRKRNIKNANGSVFAHMVDTVHRVDTRAAFRMTCEVL